MEGSEENTWAHQDSREELRKEKEGEPVASHSSIPATAFYLRSCLSCRKDRAPGHAHCPPSGPAAVNLVEYQGGAEREGEDRKKAGEEARESSPPSALRLERGFCRHALPKPVVVSLDPNQPHQNPTVAFFKFTLRDPSALQLPRSAKSRDRRYHRFTREP